ncbi:hypothetical protein [Sulfobacillus harzensis]|uniref:Uncharacterized protein n=1 Tax=Sulfobacillus harzensis TaxID=2729629 RepID=A0A7Y0L281_9FIRM|nr:hypothetical protein [Sulfobacillus harzensis]NMP21865.1 hypothetical protein [Sulfobacillus harzensis]
MNPIDLLRRVHRKECPECGSTAYILLPAQTRVPVQQGGSLGFTVHLCRQCGYARWFVDAETFSWMEANLES